MNGGTRGSSLYDPRLLPVMGEVSREVAKGAFGAAVRALVVARVEPLEAERIVAVIGAMAPRRRPTRGRIRELAELATRVMEMDGWTLALVNAALAARQHGWTAAA